MKIQMKSRSYRIYYGPWIMDSSETTFRNLPNDCFKNAKQPIPPESIEEPGCGYRRIRFCRNTFVISLQRRKNQFYFERKHQSLCMPLVLRLNSIRGILCFCKKNGY